MNNTLYGLAVATTAATIAIAGAYGIHLWIRLRAPGWRRVHDVGNRSFLKRR